MLTIGENDLVPTSSWRAHHIADNVSQTTILIAGRMWEETSEGQG